MLQHIRDRAQSWISIVIIGMVILAMSAFAWDALFRPDPIVSVAKINGEKIQADNFQRYYQAQRANLQARFAGIDIDRLIPDEDQYKQDLLDQLIDQELLWQAAQEFGFRISDLWLGEQIRALPFFQTDGQFDQSLYQQLLNQNFQTSAIFEEEFRRERIIQQLGVGIAETAWVAKETQDSLLSLQNQRRDLGYVIVDAAKYAEQVAVDDAQIQAHYDDNSADYMAPEQMSIEYLELSVNRLLQSMDVDEEALQELYQDRLGEFGVEEQRQTRHILLEVSADAADETWAEAEQRASELIERIQAGESFEDLAREHSDDIGSAQSGGDLGFLAREAMIDDAYADAAFALGENEVSSPVRSAYGYHVIEVAAIRASTVKSFEDVRATLENDYRRQQAEEAFYEQSEVLANEAFENPDSLEPAAERLGLTVQSTPLFSRDSGSGIAANAEVRDMAFADEVLNRGNNSEPMEVDVDRLVVLRVKDHKPAAVRPLEEVKTRVADDVRRQQGEIQAQATGEQILTALNDGGDAAALAEEHGLEWKEAGAITRDNRTVNRDVLAEVFRMAHPEGEQSVLNGIRLSSGDYAVLALHSVAPADVAEVDQARRDNMVLQQRLGLGRAELNAAVEALKENAKIEKYPENI